METVNCDSAYDMLEDRITYNRRTCVKRECMGQVKLNGR